MFPQSEGQQEERIHDKFKATQKLLIKEQTKPLEIMLHTQLGAVKHPGFNYMHMVARKMYLLEQQKQLEKRVQKMIEEEEVRMSRKEMIPRAQSMPFFDRSFFPQRSTGPLTVPKEPSFHILNRKCWSCLSKNELDGFETLRSKL
ncbi:protein TPX2-like [Telopea speciosissima]|uniref:protein TPX2-like n=1 Tax=Telopea speciosissima TaxID=54955 RepID=UPI001CC51ADA|nr:protein TPX2-like [Telopea speciosissima]